MEQKKKDQDVLIVRDEQTGEIGVVAGLKSDGTPNLKPAKTEHAQDFLRFDRHGDVLDNFFANFFRQCKEPNRFGFYRVAAEGVENVVAVMKDLLKDPVGFRDVLAPHKVDTTKYEQAAAQQVQETPPEPEKEELRERIEELEAMMARQAEPPGSTLDDQVALLEKSYELAAKYMPAGQGGTVQRPTAADTEEDKKTVRNGKAVAQPVGQVAERIVSALAQPMTDSEFITAQTDERNFGFQTAVGTSTAVGRNTIPACVHGNQTVTDGQSVRLRLTEPMQVAGVRIPRNTVIVGAARVQGERLGIDIISLEYQGTIIPVELAVFDSDGQEGIFIPNSMEVSAAKEVAANMGSSLGSSINISTDAGAQLASDLGKGLIQGTSQYIAQKMRTVKVHLKAGYRVMLYQPED